MQQSADKPQDRVGMVVSATRSRYRIVEDGDERYVVSGNATHIALRVVAGLTVDERARKRYPPQCIFLDGVFSGAPFCDNETRHYSLDHHAGCVRGFTLATCEQAVVMLLQGIPLSLGTWNVYVNDPDLDSVLASWVLLNHIELLADERALLRAAMPLIRLEGVIDAHGTDMELLAALPEELYLETRARIDGLMEREREIKGAGRWHSADWTEYTRDMLEVVDRLLLPETTLDELFEIQETARVALGERMAVLIRSTEGIYEVEARLKERYGGTLGVIVLELGKGRFTLRQVDTFLKKDLNAVYKVLNREDPRARANSSQPNVWGGSGNIGGAPRATGSGLSGLQILDVIRRVMGPRPGLFSRLWAFLFGRKKKKKDRPRLPPGP
jgi:hypothetical protein